jgi:hypothetical protein
MCIHKPTELLINLLKEDSIGSKGFLGGMVATLGIEQIHGIVYTLVRIQVPMEMSFTILVFPQNDNKFNFLHRILSI